MEEDKTAENFSDALFTYLWYTENLITESTAAENIGEMSEFIAEVAKAVVVLSALTVPSYNDIMDEYFLKHEMSRRTVFTFLATFCFQNHEENDNIFAVILNTCTFVYRLVIYCQHRGFTEFINFASMCWTEIFKSDLRKDFYASGGWDELGRYVNDNSYLPKNKDTDHKAFMTFLEEINYLFPKLKVCEEDEFSTPCAEKIINFEMSHMLNRANVLTTDSIINQTVDFQNSVHLVSTSICEANITADEAISAYDLLTNFYGKGCAGLNCEQSSSANKSEILDMAHVYKTLSNFINQGILEVEAATGKIIQPKIIKNANIQHATLCCTNCQHEEQVTIISSDTDQARVYPTSVVSELVHNENSCQGESTEQTDLQ